MLNSPITHQYPGPDSHEQPRVLMLACGALVRELQDIFAVNGLDNFTLECLPAALHMTPNQIPGALRQRLDAKANDFDQIMIGYADCGTVGEVDSIAEEYGAVRLPGAHCYEFFAGQATFAAMADEDPAAFYLTDYLVRHFERLVIKGLGLDRHPQLRDAYFGNYNKVVYLSQREDPELVAAGRVAADRLGLAYEHRPSGYGELEETIVSFSTLGTGKTALAGDASTGESTTAIHLEREAS